MIPVRNLYFLLCYAWDKLEEAGIVCVEAADYDGLVNLFARVLAGGLNHLLKRGLDQGYEEHYEELPGVRGRIDFAASIKARSFPQGRAICVFEQLTRDVLHNRILKSTALVLLNDEELNPALSNELRDCLKRMADVTEVQISNAMFGRVQLHSNNGFYDFLLHLCRLIVDTATLDQRTGRHRFREFSRDEKAMARLFERFLLNFYRREQSNFARVFSETLRWNVTSSTSADLQFLPLMRTDVTLESPMRKIIIDAKYYQKPMTTRFGHDSVRSSHLYQLFAYLKNQRSQLPDKQAVEGILLYPLVDTPLDLRYVLHGHAVRVVTVDLSMEWQEIHRFLLALVDR